MTTTHIIIHNALSVVSIGHKYFGNSFFFPGFLVFTINLEFRDWNYVKRHLSAILHAALEVFWHVVWSRWPPSSQHTIICKCNVSFFIMLIVQNHAAEYAFDNLANRSFSLILHDLLHCSKIYRFTITPFEWSIIKTPLTIYIAPLCPNYLYLFMLSQYISFAKKAL